MSDQELAVVVPTLGRSPVLEECLRALDGQRPRPRVVVVHSGAEPVTPAVSAFADTVLRSEAQLGFAAATNRGFAATRTRWVAAVNDDVVVQSGWAEVLLAFGNSRQDVAALQGANTVLGRTHVLDGCGIAWNAWWQAVQLHRGDAVSDLGDEPFEIAGASATATLYRRAALEDVALPDGDTFDPLFESYYEDVDLSLRLAAAGYRAFCVPTARAAHVGSATGRTLGRRRLSLIYGNRLLALWRAAGPGVLALLPKALFRDVLDALRRPGRAPAVLGGWVRALRLRGRFAKPSSAPPSLARLRRIMRRPA